MGLQGTGGSLDARGALCQVLHVGQVPRRADTHDGIDGGEADVYA